MQMARAMGQNLRNMPQDPSEPNAVHLNAEEDSDYIHFTIHCEGRV